MKLKRRTRLGLIILLFVPLVWSCEKESTGEELKENSNFAGLGSNEDSPAGSKFQFPEGIELVGEISGNYYYNNPEEYVVKNDETIFVRSQPVESNLKQGSGGLVSVLFQLKNTKNQATRVVFPAGMILESMTNEYQNGLLVKKTEVSVPANSTRNIIIDMYCCNAGRSASDGGAVYKWPIVTSNPELQKLLNAAAKKRINLEEYSFDEMGEYFGFATIVQTVVWIITERTEGFTEECQELISEIPDSTSN